MYPFLINEHFALKGTLCSFFFIGLTYTHVSFVWWSFFLVHHHFASTAQYFLYNKVGEPIDCHGPHELYIIAGGTQNQLILSKNPTFI